MSKEEFRPNNPFHILNPNRSGEELKHYTRGSYENARVEFVLKRVGLADQVKRLKRLALSETGVQLLTFRLFREEYPSFPVLLTCHNLTDLKGPLHTLNTAILPAWFKEFTHLPFMPHYQQLFDELPQSQTELSPVGMIFPRRGFPQGLIIHNGDMERYVPPQSSAHVYLGGDKKHHPMLVVQPLVSLLDYIYRKGHGWKP